MTDFYLVVADQIDNTQRTQIQHVIREHAESWWHEFLDVWIVKGGESLSFWLKELRAIVPVKPSGILILKLPPDGSRAYASRAGASLTWLKEEYMGRKPTKAIESEGS
ncbi:hypothetical protein GCM10023176_54970 [Micromonospora coerulea]|uniref:SinR family protein n=1 Tax=Micromonospora coerulea TaxID=47856 RepID=A0ABP8SZM3_9ACTN